MRRRPRHERIWAGAAGIAALALAGAVAERRHNRRVARDPENMTLAEPPVGETVAVRSADGTQLHAEIFGDGATTFVLAHGWTESLTYWTYLIDRLTGAGHRVVAYDLRGHGQSEPASGGDYSVRRFGEDVEAVLEALAAGGAARTILAGHSLGAMSVAAWAEHHEVERRIAAAALINTGVGDLIAEQLLFPVPRIAQAVNKTIAVRGFLGSRAPLPRFSTPLSYTIVRYIAFGPHATPAQIAFYERMLFSCPPDVRADVGIALSEVELHHALERLTVPTSVIAGDRDRLTPPSHARRMAEMLPQLEQLIVLPETGHMGPLERPGEITQALLRLASVAAPVTA